VSEEQTPQAWESDRVAYVPPRLTRYGSLAELTAGLGQQNADGLTPTHS